MLFDSMINVLWVQIFENSTSLWSEIDCLLLWKRMVSIRSVQRHHYLCLFLCWLQWQNYLCLYSDSIHGKCVETEWRAYLCNSVPFIICIKFDKYKKNLENKIWQRKLLNGIIVYVFSLRSLRVTSNCFRKKSLLFFVRHLFFGIHYPSWCDYSCLFE